MVISRIVRRVLDFHIPIPLYVQGSWIAYITTRILLRRVYEPETTALIRSLVRPGMRVADIGTQYGYFTLLFANLVGDTGTVYAFDPDPVSFERMQGNVRRNGYTQVSCSNKGVADRSGTARFYASTLGYGKDSMFPKPNKEMPSYEFPLTTLDEAISGDIDFFKIDVEGAELLVLEGATRILENPAVCGIVEFHPRALIRAGNYESFLPTLRAYNFTIHAINLDGSVEALSDNELRTLAETHDGINIFLRK